MIEPDTGIRRLEVDETRAMIVDEIGCFRVVFWDFDGVIKESVDVKSRAFFDLFRPFGVELANKVLEHHEANGGMSRFDKIPLYLDWSGVPPDQKNVDAYCHAFAQRVTQGVIDSPWVKGVESYLRHNEHQQTFVLVSATPQDELAYILNALSLSGCFTRVYGAPTRKEDAIQETLSEWDLMKKECLMIGDAKADLQAAASNGIRFLLRRHASNTRVFTSYTGDSIEDFTQP